jgi:exodeoxyribonuclease V alpha subunit
VTTFEGEVTIRRRRFANEQNGFAVLDAELDGAPVVLVGALAHLEERERVRIVATQVVDPRFGEQLKVSRADPLPPSDEAALIAYLRRVRHVGIKRARALLERSGSAGVIEAIDRDPPAAFRAAGLSARRAQEAARDWNELRVTRRLYLLLAPHGLAYLVPRIHAEYGASAARVLIANPYELTRVFGVGFATADRIARLASPRAPGEGPPPGRARAALIHLLGEAERGGSTCLPLAALLAAANELLGDEEADACLVAELESAGDLVSEEGFVYRARTYELESELASRIASLVGAGACLEPVEEELIDGAGGSRAASAEGTGRSREPPSPEQRAAVITAFAHRLSVITGGPGTGKTATIRTLAEVAAHQRIRITLLAPTGRAAARMSESSGARASTVHSALGWIPGEPPEHDQEDPLSTQLLVLDESSMANLELLVALLRAVPDGAHVVLVGDADQLAPVGAGKPFAELVESEAVPTTRLTHIFRQAAGSMIVQGAHAVRRGRPPSFDPAPGMRRDLFLIERSQPREALEEVVSLLSRRLPQHYGVDPISDVQVFAPVYRGDLGIDALNAALREALNPDGRPVGSGRLRIGDKVMMTGRNLHELRLMNGTLLRLIDEVEGGEGDEPALLLAGEETVFRLSPEESESLRLAYACSVHRGQGIELPVAVVVAHPAAGAFFLRREMLYTALTRAKLATVIVGSAEVVARAARTPDTGKRHSRLAQRLG